MPNFSVIMPAAGKSSRFTDKHYKKPFVPLANRAVWLHSAEKFLNRDDVKQLMIVVAEEDLQWFQDKFSANVTILGVEVIRGGATRTESVAAALNHLRDVDLVLLAPNAKALLELLDEILAGGRQVVHVTKQWRRRWTPRRCQWRRAASPKALTCLKPA